MLVGIQSEQNLDANYANELHEFNRGRVSALAQGAVIALGVRRIPIGVQCNKNPGSWREKSSRHTERFAKNSRPAVDPRKCHRSIQGATSRPPSLANT